MSTKTKVPTVFWIIAIIALLWNLMGVGAFLYDSFAITPEAISSMEEPMKSFYENSPAWLKIPYAIATFGGLLGAILLLLRKKLALPVFVVSLLGVLIQMGASIFATEAIEVLGMQQAVIMPLFIVAISAFLVYYSRKSIAMSWIN